MNTQPLESLLKKMAHLIEEAVGTISGGMDLFEEAQSLFNEIKPALDALQPQPNAPVAITAKTTEKKESGRVGKNISEQEFKERILKLWLKCFDFEGEPSDYTPENVLQEMTCCPKFLNDRITKDLSKIEFDTENWTIKGFQKLPNGLIVLPVEAGGDWECPLMFILYFDGTNIRGYIPKEGNPYNRKTKMAFGNNEDADAAEGYKYGDYAAHQIDYTKAFEDCSKRIKLQP